MGKSRLTASSRHAHGLRQFDCPKGINIYLQPDHRIVDLKFNLDVPAWNSPTHSCTWVSSMGFSIFHNFEPREAIALKRSTLSWFTILYIPMEYFDLTVRDYWEIDIWKSHTWNSSTRMRWWISGQVPHTHMRDLILSLAFLQFSESTGI